MTPEREKVLREWVLVDEIWADLDSLRAALREMRDALRDTLCVLDSRRGRFDDQVSIGEIRRNATSRGDEAVARADELLKDRG